jgi:hypothetical protein
MTARDDLRDFDRANGRVRTALDAAANVLGLGADRVVRVWRPDASGESPLTAELASGRRLRWERQADMLKPRELVFPVLAVGLGPKKPLLGAQAQEVYRAFVGACNTLESLDALDEATEWLEGFQTVAAPLTVRAGSDDAQAFAVLQDFRDVETLASQVMRRSDALSPPVLVDLTHKYVRRADLAAYVRAIHHVNISWRALTGRVAEVGWEPADLQRWEPDVPRGEAQHVRVRAYRRALP